MAQVKPKKSNFLFWFVLIAGGAGAVAWVYTTPDTTKHAAPAKPKSSKSAASGNSLITDEDYKAHFELLSNTSKDAFKPLVARATSASGLPPGVPANLNIPADLADGDPNWAFTGTAEVNGTHTALLENKTTGAGDFIHPGQRWKSSTVVRIDDNKLQLKGDDGEVHDIMILADGEAMLAKQQADMAAMRAATSPTPTTNPNAPVNPALSGPIGISPDPGQMAAAQPDPGSGASMTIQLPQQGGNRRRRGFGRRNGGGGGFGG